MSKGFHLETRIPIPFMDRAVHITADAGKEELRFRLGPRAYDLSFQYRCPEAECEKWAHHHSNLGASLLWCPDHGLLAILSKRSGDFDDQMQMSDEQYETFVKERFDDLRDG